MSKVEIKDTLLMPKTKYPMKGNLINKEPEIQQKWLDNKIYEQLMEKNKNNEAFYLHDGPPYANGDIHLGHALNKILKDIIIRQKNMLGFYSPFTLGWDTHGLPIENALLKNKKIKAKELSVEEFRDKCKEYALKQVENQKENFLRLGILNNGEDKYVTLDQQYEAEQIRVFGKMIEKGMIFKGLKPVYWSPSSITALAEAEIEYMDKKSPAIYVAFDLLDDDLSDVKAVIWTTTPWTIPANQGISVGSDITYSIIDCEYENKAEKIVKEKYLIAENLVENFVQTLNISQYKVEKTILGSELENKKVQHPLNKKEFLIMLGDHVTDESGTGCVHTAPGHGEDDFIVGKKYNLETLSVVDQYGKMINTDKYDGIFYEDANKEIGMDLESCGALLKLSFIKHSYPHDWRTKKPVIFRATPQWFASIDKDKAGMLNALDEVKWINSWGQKRLHNMIAGRGEWCISRQRKWGVPIPIFYTEKEEPIFDKEVIEHVANLFEEHGSGIWFSKDAKDLLPNGYTHKDSPNGLFTKEQDIMDVWFDSGVSHSAVMNKRYGTFQADLYLEGSDQYRGWFNSSLITGYITQGKAPFKQVMSHGFVLDAKGLKMSKSLGNTMVPKDIYNKYGADILRLWVSTVDFQSDVRVSDDIIKQVSDIYRRIRNSFKFILGNLPEENLDIIKNLDKNKLEIVDKYILIQLDELIKNVTVYYNEYDFKKIIDEINKFMINDLSSFYFDYTKDVLYIEKEDANNRRAVQYVLYEIITTLLKMLAPIIPHTADETWAYLEENSIVLEEFPVIKNYVDKSEVEEIKTTVNKIIDLRNDVNKSIENKRENKIIGKSFESKVSILIQNDKYEELKNIENLDLYLIVSKVEFVNNIDEQYDEYEDFAIKIEKYSEHNCIRCWKYYQEEELNSEGICLKCQEIIK